MPIVKINLDELPVGKSLPFNIVNSSGILVIPKNTTLTEDICQKLEDIDLFVDSPKKTDGLDFENEAKALVTNTLSQINLGKEVASFNLFQKEASGYSLIKCEYVGWVKDLALVIEMPRQGNGEFAKLFQLDPGQKIQAKMHVGNNEYIFQSFVISVTNNPLPLAFIKHPATVKTIKVRTANRKEVNLSGFIRYNGLEHEVRIIDISDSGVAFLSDLIIDTNATFDVVVNFKINESPQVLVIPVKIRNSRGLGAKHRYGVSFEENLIVKDKIFLQSFIYTL